MGLGLAACAGAAVAALWPAGRACRADLLPPEDPPRESWATSPDGSRLRVLEYGPPGAPPLVLAHGWSCASEVWLPQAREFAGRFRVVAFDQRGHGRSDAGRAAFSTDLLADDLEAVLAHVLREGERAVLVGHSMGGMGVIAWADRHPHRVRERAKAAVLVGTSASCRPRQLPFGLLGGVGRRIADNAYPWLFGLSVPVGGGLLGESRLARAGVRRYALSPGVDEADAAFIARLALACPPRARGEWQRALVPLDIRPGVARLTVPTTVVVGDSDRVLPLGHSRRIAEALAEHGWLEWFVVLPGVGHIVGLEATGALNAVIRGAAEAAERRCPASQQ